MLLMAASSLRCLSSSVSDEASVDAAISRVEAELPPIVALFQVPHDKGTARAPKQFVDLQNDVTAAGIELATREGFESVEHVKRYTALGFGTDQGKLGNINGLAIAARGLDIAGLEAVINVDVTPDSEIHIHRVGRTGRVGQQGGAEGLALNLASMDEMGSVGKIDPRKQGNKGKACKERRRLAIIPAAAIKDGEIAKAELAVLSLPVTSLGNWGNYVN